MKLTDKQSRFCEEYMIDLNATQAAIRAGYSEKTAYSIGCENLIKPDLQNRIQELKKEITERNAISVDTVVDQLTKILNISVKDCYDENGNLKSVENLADETAYAISEVSHDEIYADKNIIGRTTKYKYHDKLKAADMLLKILGGYKVDNEQKTIILPTTYKLIDATNRTS